MKGKEPMCFYPTQHQKNKRDAQFDSQKVTVKSLWDRSHNAHAPPILYNAYANASERVGQVLLTIVILKCHEPSQHFRSSSRFGRIVTGAAGAFDVIDAATGDNSLGIVVGKPSRLYEIHRD